MKTGTTDDVDVDNDEHVQQDVTRRMMFAVDHRFFSTTPQHFTRTIKCSHVIIIYWGAPIQKIKFRKGVSRVLETLATQLKFEYSLVREDCSFEKKFTHECSFGIFYFAISPTKHLQLYNAKTVTAIVSLVNAIQFVFLLFNEPDWSTDLALRSTINPRPYMIVNSRLMVSKKHWDRIGIRSSCRSVNYL